jgi:GntR family transcriptional regulator
MRPIYEQIRDEIRKLVITGALKPGERIPSVRELAATLAINPNTIQRAYRELEGEGYIYSISGKGSFAALDNKALEKRQESTLQNFDETVKELLFLGVGPEALQERMNDLYLTGR